jgi:hypothetical protein
MRRSASKLSYRIWSKQVSASASDQSEPLPGLYGKETR